jgi:hypothetical protein
MKYQKNQNIYQLVLNFSVMENPTYCVLPMDNGLARSKPRISAASYGELNPADFAISTPHSL